MNDWNLGDFKMNMSSATESYSMASLVDKLYEKVIQLTDQCDMMKQDIKRLEQENIELTNSLYEVSNSLEARIDIFAEEIIKNRKHYEF